MSVILHVVEALTPCEAIIGVSLQVLLLYRFLALVPWAHSFATFHLDVIVWELWGALEVVYLIRHHLFIRIY